MTIIDTIIIGGGQAGLATAHVLNAHGTRPVLLEAGDEPAGSWPHYYDGLHLFSPARYSALPGMPFPAAPEAYPHRDEVADYLRAYAARLGADVRTRTRAERVEKTADGFAVHVRDGELHARRLVVATGGFARPYVPDLGLGDFTGTILHTSAYREPGPFAGRRVVVVGGGNSAVQIGVELAAVARVTLATRRPVRLTPQLIAGRDVHFWSAATGLDRLPVGRLLRRPPASAVFDTGSYALALADGRPDRRPMFTRAEGADLIWADGTREEVDAVVLATGYRPDTAPLTGVAGALDPTGGPRHRGGVSPVPGLGFVGLEWQRSLASATIRGVGRDAAYVVKRLR